MYRRRTKVTGDLIVAFSVFVAMQSLSLYFRKVINSVENALLFMQCTILLVFYTGISNPSCSPRCASIASRYGLTDLESSTIVNDLNHMQYRSSFEWPIAFDIISITDRLSEWSLFITFGSEHQVRSERAHALSLEVNQSLPRLSSLVVPPLQLWTSPSSLQNHHFRQASPPRFILLKVFFPKPPFFRVTIPTFMRPRFAMQGHTAPWNEAFHWGSFGCSVHKCDAGDVLSRARWRWRFDLGTEHAPCGVRADHGDDDGIIGTRRPSGDLGAINLRNNQISDKSGTENTITKVSLKAWGLRRWGQLIALQAVDHHFCPCPFFSPKLYSIHTAAARSLHPYAGSWCTFGYRYIHQWYPPSYRPTVCTTTYLPFPPKRNRAQLTLLQIHPLLTFSTQHACSYQHRSRHNETSSDVAVDDFPILVFSAGKQSGSNERTRKCPCLGTINITYHAWEW